MNCRLLLFLIIIIQISCSDPSAEVDCNTLVLELSSKSDPTSCSSPDGQISVAAQGGTPPYTFRIDNEGFQSENSFMNLPGGDHFIAVSDASACEQSIMVSITNFNSTLDATFTVVENTECLIGNGTVLFSPQGGEAPYQLRIGSTTISTSLEVTGLKHGVHQIVVVDALQCEIVKSITIPRGNTNISFVNDIKTIIETRCAKPTCHVPTTGRADFTKFENIQLFAGQIKSRSQNKSMPFDGPLPDDQIQLIACWVDDGALDN